MTVSIPGFPTSDPEPGVHLFGILGQGQGSGGAKPLRALLVSQKVSEPAAQGTQANDEIVRISNAEDAAQKWGYGCGIHHMADALISLCPLGEYHGCSIAAGAGSPVQAIKALTWSGTATTSGRVTMQVAGKNFVADFSSGVTAAEVAAAMSALIGEALAGPAANYTGIPVYSSVVGAVQTLKSKWKSADCNDIGYAIKIEGLANIAVDSTSGTLASGAVESAWDDALDVLADSILQFDYVLFATGDTAVLTSGVDALKARLKAMRRPDGGFKLLKAIAGNNTSESDAHTFASSWEEGTAVDETGAFGQVWWGDGQTAPPWIVSAACAGVRFAAEIERVNKNPCQWGGTEVAYLPVPLFKTDWPTRADIRAALNEGVSPLFYDPNRNITLMLRSITCKHSTGGVTDYKARPTVVPVVIDYILYDLKGRLEAAYSDFFVADDDANGNPPDDLGPRTVTPSRFKRRLGAMLKDYEREGLLENADALAQAIIAERNLTVTSRLDADAGAQVRRWLEQIGVLLREVGGAA